MSALLALLLALLGGTHAAPAPVKHVSSAAVVAKFDAAGLEADTPMPVAQDDYGVAPHTTKDGTHFVTPSVCSDCGGRVWVYDSAGKLRAGQAAYDALGKRGDPFFSWTFTEPSRFVLVQLNGDMPAATAQKYQAVVAAL